MSVTEEQEVRRTLTIRNSRGLHARAAGKLVREAGQFESEIWVMRTDMVVSADSIMGLMMLAAAPGCTIDVWARGQDALEAMKAIENLVERGFDEDAQPSA
jgi:phosphocarrier protein